ncbi:hypothetical protein [Terriglobus aquaticus]|uniref:UbiA prenyltransferase family protein n=1 Tax=Terriglobus aquaticus TaxID=940139 RepID=A0ABW9KH93_9BACT|nr:hypothetical protein [Terriglobus aquaticus]
MGASAATLAAETRPCSAPLRLLGAWHLLSLDAPTVAFCWLLFFAEIFRVPHPLPAAADLACAVWLVYMVDRVLDARRHQPAWTAPSRDSLYETLANPSHDALFHLYRHHARAFLIAGVAVTLLGFALVALLPHALIEAWVLLTAPLLLYAAVVHLLHLSARWKAISVGIFFAVAVALPAAAHGGLGWPIAAAAIAFGGVCRANCAILRAPSQRLRIVFVLCTAAALLPLFFTEARAITPACLLALAFLLVLRHRREAALARVGSLGWRALVDVALVAPALVIGSCIALFRG